jgi:hypothetical protein
MEFSLVLVGYLVEFSVSELHSPDSVTVDSIYTDKSHDKLL